MRIQREEGAHHGVLDDPRVACLLARRGLDSLGSQGLLMRLLAVMPAAGAAADDPARGVEGILEQGHAHLLGKRESTGRE